MEIKVKSYDGEYPTLCMGHLVIEIDGVEWDFGKYCLVSGGSAGFIEEDGDPYADSYVEEGDWGISGWPRGFPEDEELRRKVLEVINATIPHGCCGGCL